MSAELTIRQGSARSLPFGDAAWRLESGAGELYLATPERQRLVRDIAAGDCVAALAAGHATLVLVATAHCHLITCAPDAACVIVRPDESENVFAAEDEARARALVARIGARSLAGTNRRGVAAALAEVAAAFGLESGDSLDGNWDSVPMLARASGMRAARVVLADGWWRDDGGPLLLRTRDGGEVSAALWSRGRYRCHGVAVDGGAYDASAWRLFAPLAQDVSSFRGMAGSVIGGLRQELPLIAIAGLGTALLGVLVPIATGWIFDDIVPAGAGGLLIAAGIALLVAALVGAVIASARTMAVVRVSGRGQSAMAAAVADRVLRLPVRFFKTVSAGDFNQRLEALDGIRQLVTIVLLNAGLTLAFALVYLLLLLSYDARMTLAGLTLTLVYAGAVIVSRRAQIGPLREAAERDGKLAGLTFELLEGVPKLRAAAAEDRALARWNRAYALERAAAARGQRVANHFDAFADSWGIVTMMGLFATAALLVQAEVSPGQFIAFLAAFALFQGSFTAFCEAVMAIQTAKPLADRARPILMAAAEAAAGRADPGTLTGDIQASGLTFGYDNAMVPLIDNLSFVVRPGEHLAIVGGSGSGKSTILRLVLGFETPTTGSLAYDGQELASLDPARVRAQIGVVLQSSQLFAGTIFENIRGATQATIEDCLIAAAQAGLKDDLDGFPMGLHTMITEGAGTLSGGQRQRILIARALAAKPRILFFDEATSALDNATQAIVARTLDQAGATRVTIAHRLSTVRNADRICVLERGRFVESGTFTELMARNSAFAELARRQLLED
jgi:NHLM bacteriocin system ABC transporter ATP-binding protein